MRKTKRLRHGWKFSRINIDGAEKASFDDSSWENVSIPHDWAVNGPFFKGYDAQFTRIVNNFEKAESLHLGRTGGLPHDGRGAYRLEFDVPQEDAQKTLRLEFDGVMSHAQIFVNGEFVYARPYGYSSFACDITPFISTGKKNILAVIVDNPPASTRWYPGAGIYRDARLVTLSKTHIIPNGIWIRTKKFDCDAEKAEMLLAVATNEHAAFDFEVFSPSGEKVYAGNSDTGKAAFALENVEAWSPDTPNLYTLRVSLADDCAETTFGIRKITFDAEKGMSINEKPFRMNGVCMHHDLGPLGAAFSRPAAERQLRILKSIGVNALRCTHNPPAPAMLDLCDRMGIVAIDEAFDCWQMGKVKNDYHVEFDEWHEHDLSDMIERDRNHPCIILWSIGNEILEQGDPNGWKLAAALQDIVHKTDPDRPATAGLSFETDAIDNGMAAVIDVPGFNYKPHRYAYYRSKLPGKPFFASETASTVSTRGEYYFPIQEGFVDHPTIQCSSYDVEYPAWASTPDKEFHFQDQQKFVMGEFVWTGFDYLGEPCPFDYQWPAHSAYFGIFDLVGLPKDRAYLYKSRWCKSEPTLHILPHWNFPERLGKSTPVHVYTSFDEVELFVNGKSQGRKRKNGAYRITWDYVVYEPGELMAVAYNANGDEAMRTFRRTAGAPVSLKIELENSIIDSDGEDLAFARISAVDSHGEVAPRCCDRVKFYTDGPLELAGVANGDPTSLETFDQNHIHLFNGYAVVYLRAREGMSGSGILTARTEHMSEATATIKIR